MVKMAPRKEPTVGNIGDGNVKNRARRTFTDTDFGKTYLKVTEDGRSVNLVAETAGGPLEQEILSVIEVKATLQNLLLESNVSNIEFFKGNDKKIKISYYADGWETYDYMQLVAIHRMKTDALYPSGRQ